MCPEGDKTVRVKRFYINAKFTSLLIQLTTFFDNNGSRFDNINLLQAPS